ncbi:zinc-ribbon domain-containing protein [Anaerocolumna xylanovorans]|uniref:EF-hand domain-containing protein n=1 Tax=Anaerocolumna xylanovorans DSM 12503 TaxID=1121345 RepID=A0A1M7Y7T0_9FIRM|nr:zinc ribbon domain-containing protein [Anaerocolumna xylanovorans]SHO48682.1 protein of unknown function [Anaerocolumna xylanovorans DSM 12503]
MYCEQCGTKNADGAKFCEACGAKMEMPLPKQGPVEVKPVEVKPAEVKPVEVKTIQAPAKPPMKTWKKVMIAAVVGIAILLFAGFKMGQSYYSPEKVTERYMKSIQKEDWKQAFSYLDLEKTNFINAESFKEAMDNELDYSKIKNFTVAQNAMNIGGADRKINGLAKAMTVYYIADGSSGQQEMTINLIKVGKKEFYIFDKWEVSPETLLVSDYSIEVPSGMKVSVDGQKVSADSLESTEDGIDRYNVKSILRGKHTIEVTSPYTEDVKEEIYPENDTTYDYMLSEITLKQDVIDGLVKQAEDDYIAIYKAALEGKGFDEVKGLFSSDQDVQSEYQGAYESLVEMMKNDDGTGITNLTLRDFSGGAEYISGYSISPQTISMNVTFDYEYTSKDWWTGDLEERSDSTGDSYDVTYQLEGDKWVISYIYLNSIYYY